MRLRWAWRGCGVLYAAVFFGLCHSVAAHGKGYSTLLPRIKGIESLDRGLREAATRFDPKDSILLQSNCLREKFKIRLGPVLRDLQ